MSRYTDINQLLDEIGTSGRSASDPWTLSRGASGEVRRDSFEPAVTADLGAPLEGLGSQMQSSARITQAEIAQSASGSSQSTQSSPNGGLLGGLLNFFPLASGIAKLFGFGGSSPTPAPTPFVMPPSINFEGAVTGPGSGVSSLSYGSNGLPRTVGQAPPVSNFTSNAAAEIGQLATPANSTFVPTPSPVSQSPAIPSSSQPGTTEPAAGSSSPLDNGQMGSAASSSNSQQSHNILVQVQAMDSQSFMDHSHDIAQAVRQAMLNMNSLNDVIQDL
ncbi:MAG TPA: hypothetical protein VGL72_25765 [Bryobacteraceae bacterium]|jgi:hypothetical protein